MNLYIRIRKNFAMGKWFIFQEYYKTQTFSVNWVVFIYFIGTQRILSYVRVGGKERRCLISGSVSLKKHFSNAPPPPKKKNQQPWMTLFQHLHIYSHFGALTKSYEIRSRYFYSPCCTKTQNPPFFSLSKPRNKHWACLSSTHLNILKY